jgi:hypothetical protein
MAYAPSGSNRKWVDGIRVDRWVEVSGAALVLGKIFPLDGPQTRFERTDRRKIESRFLGRVPRSPVAVLTEPAQLGC